jgi:hypothetical protein
MISVTVTLTLLLVLILLDSIVDNTEKGAFFSGFAVCKIRCILLVWHTHHASRVVQSITYHTVLT